MNQKEVKKNYKKYIIPKSISSKSITELCKPPKKFKHQFPQKFLSEFMKSTKQNGILVFHQIGSGKTCTAISIAEKHKKKKKIVVLLPASLIGNFRDELRSPCAFNEYMTDAERNSFNSLSVIEQKELIKKTDERIDRYYTIMSYNKFLTSRVSLKNAVLIIDEIQNMISMEGSFYKKIKKVIESAPDDLKVILLSATPIFDKPIEIALTLNLLPLKNKFDIDTFNDTFVKSNGLGMKNKTLFKKMTKGVISFYRGMPKQTFPKANIKIVKCKMEPFQNKSYNIVLNKEAKKKVDIVKLPNNFFIGSRIISNIAFPNNKVNKKGFESWTGKALAKENLKKYSIKFYKILKKIKQSEGKVFIYSNFLKYGGIGSLVEVLQYHNYYDFKEYFKMDTSTRDKKKFFAIWSGDETLQYKESIKYFYNLKNSPLQIILGSAAAKEGISFKRVRQIHILEPYWNAARIKQIIGRGVRYCSHADLPARERKVDVFIYLSVRQNESSFSKEDNIIKQMSIDRYIQHLSDSKNKLIEEFEKCMKEVAVDCELNKELNGVKCSES